MTPRRDVEEEIYAQLYGEPSEPEDRESTRVIDGDHRTRPVREDPEPEPRPLEALGLAAAAGARSAKKALRATWARGQRDAVGPTRAQRLRDVAHSARAQRLREVIHSARARAARRLDGRERRLGLGALALGLVGLMLVAGLSAGSGDEPQRIAGPPPEQAANQSAADSAARREARQAREAREAREARRRRASRRRAAAQRRREKRAIASPVPAPAADTSMYNQAPTTDVGCPEDSDCLPRRSLVDPHPAHDHEDTEQPDRETVGKPKKVIGRYFEYEVSVRKGDVDVDVDVDVPEFD